MESFRGRWKGVEKRQNTHAINQGQKFRCWFFFLFLSWSLLTFCLGNLDIPAWVFISHREGHLSCCWGFFSLLTEFLAMEYEINCLFRCRLLVAAKILTESRDGLSPGLREICKKKNVISLNQSICIYYFLSIYYRNFHFTASEWGRLIHLCIDIDIDTFLVNTNLASVWCHFRLLALNVLCLDGVGAVSTPPLKKIHMRQWPFLYINFR